MPLTFVNSPAFDPAAVKRLRQVFTWLPQPLQDEPVTLEGLNRDRWKAILPPAVQANTWASDGNLVWCKLPATEAWVLLHERAHRAANRFWTHEQALGWAALHTRYRNQMPSAYARNDHGRPGFIAGWESWAECCTVIWWEPHNAGKPPPGYDPLKPIIRKPAMALLKGMGLA